MLPVICFSEKPATSPTTTDATRKSAISSGNHQPRFHHGSCGRGTCVTGSTSTLRWKIESHGMTENTSNTKVNVVIPRMIFWRPVSVRWEADSSFFTSSASSGRKPTSERSGLAFARSA
jgi:hypothetical protein